MGNKDEAIRRNFIIDEEIDLFEKQNEADVQKKDLLNTTTYVNTLTNCVMNAPKDRSFTIGLFGEWGSGKSSIIRTFSKDVVKKYAATDQKVKVITYDAWKYSNDSFRRMFLLQMQKDLGYKREQLMNSFYLNSSEDVDIKSRFNLNYLSIGFFVAFLLVLGIYFIPFSDPDAKVLANTIVALCSLLYTIFMGAIQEMKVNIQKPHMFAPEQFEACYDEMTDMALGIKRDVWDYIKPVKGVTGLHRLIIVIDNVDRCSSELAYELLTNIKNFLGQKHNTIFVIPVDEDSLKKHIVKNNPMARHESDEFLRKFFNICIRIKPFHQEEMFDFADQLNTKYGVRLNSNTIGLISQEFASNPRRIIQMMNNLIAEFQNIPSQFVKKDESLICKLLIIREEYADFYKALVKDATLLFNSEGQNIYIEKNEQLKRFLYRTNSISQVYKNHVETVESILSNSVVFDKIPQKVLDEVSSDETKETKAYIANTANKNKLLNYVLQKIQVNISRNAYKSGVNLYTNYLMRISQECELSRGDYARIADIVRDLSLSDYLLGETSIRPLELFAQKMADENQSILNGKLTALLRDEQNFQKLSNDMVRDGVFFGYTIWKGNMLTNLQTRLHKCYEEKPEELFAFDYGDNKAIVFDDDIIGKIIEAQFKDNQLVEKSNNLFIKLINTITISEKNLSLAIEKLSEKIENYKNNNDSRLKVEQYTNYLTQILTSLPKEYVLQNTKSLETFVTKVCHTYSDNVNYRNYTRAYYTDEQDNGKRTKFVDFMFQVSRVSKKTIIPEAYLKIMFAVPDTVDYILGRLNALLVYSYPMSNYANEIFEITKLTPDLLKLYKYLFVVTTTPNKKYIVSDEVVSQKLKPILTQLLAENTELKEECEKLLLSLFADERCAKILLDIISAETTENIQKLPQTIHKQILPVFNEHFDDYSDKMSIMLIMAEDSNAEIQAKVVRKIVNMLTTSGKEKDAFSLIKKLKTRDKKHVAMLVSTLEGMTPNNALKQERDECLNLFQKKDNSVVSDTN